MSLVTAAAAAAPDVAAEHFAARLSLETDCWDVHEALAADADFRNTSCPPGPAAQRQGPRD